MSHTYRRTGPPAHRVGRGMSYSFNGKGHSTTSLIQVTSAAGMWVDEVQTGLSTELAATLRRS
jgi:hypothetical protein